MGSRRSPDRGAAPRERVRREFTLVAQVEGHVAAYEPVGGVSALGAAATAAGSRSA